MDSLFTFRFSPRGDSSLSSSCFTFAFGDAFSPSFCCCCCCCCAGSFFAAGGGGVSVLASLGGEDAEGDSFASLGAGGGEKVLPFARFRASLSLLFSSRSSLLETIRLFTLSSSCILWFSHPLIFSSRVCRCSCFLLLDLLADSLLESILLTLRSSVLSAFLSPCICWPPWLAFPPLPPPLPPTAPPPCTFCAFKSLAGGAFIAEAPGGGAICTCGGIWPGGGACPCITRALSISSDATLCMFCLLSWTSSPALPAAMACMACCIPAACA
mmetsp:Transcript_2754/g.8238  ORF Transcript_2754/g.8238 Transcript_2754/m.8238 type:complete len:270 (+) Transcript_2754:384-1193(+)